jgi:anti-sigma-K factor RskA
VAVVVAIGLGVTLGVQHRQLDQARGEQRAVAAVLNAPDARIVTDRAKPGGTVTMVASRSLHRMLVTSAGLPALPSSRTYQVWLIRAVGKKVTFISAGLVPAASSGRTAPLLASGLTAKDIVGVTVEPAGGTKQPTTTPIVELHQDS